MMLRPRVGLINSFRHFSSTNGEQSDSDFDVVDLSDTEYNFSFPIEKREVNDNAFEIS